MSILYNAKLVQIPNIQPTKFKSISSTSKKPILNINCTHSITNIATKQIMIGLMTFLENLLEIKKPKGRNGKIFPIIFLKAYGSVIFLKYGNMLLKGMTFIFLILLC